MRKIKYFILTIIALISVGGLVSCTSDDISDPKDAIIERYGDRQFKISFYAETLSEPISDIYYSAKSMPNLPTPSKVGYAFAGWYFDSALTQVCDVSNGDLYWKMCDLTLYAKWEEERIVNNGTYDIKYEATIVEGSLVKGLLTDKYGYLNFPDDIIEDGTYIEKNNSGTFLRIEYNSHFRGPIFAENSGGEFEVQTYTISSEDGLINEDLSVLDRTSIDQIIYVDITNRNLSDTITLNVSFYNWGADLEDGEDRNQTTVVYKVAFKITSFIGFSKSFVNISTTLDDGIYLVPTHFTGLNKAAAMLDAFHPVYSYIVAKGGHYTLIKPMSAYNSDITGNLSGSDYYIRTTGYAREFTYFLCDQDKVLTEEEANSTDVYVPEILGANTYGTLAYEFKASTGLYYYTIDLGTTLNQDVILYGGSTGAMEQMFSFPYHYRRLTISYDSMIGINSSTYEALDGDSYTYTTEVPFYAGYTTTDFANSNAVKEVLDNYKSYVSMVNLFFSKAKNENYDTKITITPTASTKELDLKNSRYKFSYFDITYEAYGYDPVEDGELYSASTNFITLHSVAATDFLISEVKNGETLDKGTSVNMLDLYTKYVYRSAVEANISWDVYEVDKYGMVDYSKKLSYSKNFTFERSVAVLFTCKYDTYERTSLVYLLESEDINPTIKSDDYVYDSDNNVYKLSSSNYMVGDVIDMPEIAYTSYNTKYTTYDHTKYDDDKPYTSFLKVLLYEYNAGVYLRVYNQYNNDTPDGYKTNTFDMTSGRMRVEYRLYNILGEWESIWFEYTASNVSEYEISNGSGIVSSGDLSYTSGVRNAITFKDIDSYVINTNSDLSKILNKYTIKYNETNGDLTTKDINLSSLTIYLKDSTKTVYSLDDVWNIIKDENYAVIRIDYLSDYGDKVYSFASYNLKIDSKSLSEYEIVGENIDLFVGESIELEKPKVFGLEDVALTRGYYYIYLVEGNNLKQVGSDNYSLTNETTFGQTLTFIKSGNYVISLSVALKLDANGHKILDVYDQSDLSTYINIELVYRYTVYDTTSNIDVTYVTDKYHPFDSSKINYTTDGDFMYYTKIVSMAETNLSLDRSYFLKTSDVLYGWSTSTDEADRVLSAGSSIGTLGVKLKTVTPTLYALWDSGLVVNAYYDINDTTDSVLGTITFYKSTSGGKYTMSLFSFRQYYAYFDSDYEIVGWRASKAIFQDGYGMNATYSDYYAVTTDTAFQTGWSTNERELTLYLVLRKKMKVVFSAIDESENTYDFSRNLATQNIIEKQTLKESLSGSYYNRLKSPSIKNSTLTFKHWAIRVYNGDNYEYKAIDIDNDLMLQEYIKDGVITLYAIFGGE